MKYKIEEAVITGIKNPSLIVRGWVDSSAIHMIIKDNNKVIEKKLLIKNRSKITTFNYSIELNGSTRVQVYFANEEIEEKAVTVKSNLGGRILNKVQPRGIMINKIKGKISDPLKKELKAIHNDTYDMKDDIAYNRWLVENNDFVPIRQYSYQPKISIVMPVYNVPGEYLGYCLDSILNQTYQNFEICIADDCSTNQDTIETLKEYINKDKRIKVVFRKENGHISRATNSALELATGEFVGLMDNDDKLEKHALNEVVNVLNENKELDFIYTDEDKIDMQEHRSDPHFKSDFAIHSLYGGNYICHFSVIRKTLIDEIGGFRVGYEGAQDFDLFLRLIEKTSKIHHIPKVLYHWRMIPGSTAVGGDGAKNYAGEAGKRALEDYFGKKNINVKVDIVISTQYFVEYVIDKEPKVTVIIVANKDQGTILKSIDHISKDNVYDNYSVIVINNTNLSLTLLESQHVKIIEANNNVISTINDIVKEIDSEYLIFTSEENEYETIDWMYNLVGYSSRPENGVIGGKVIGKHGLARRSGLIFNSQTTLINACFPTYREDYGSNGRLLVPYNYSIVESEIFALKKDDFIPLDERFNYEFACYDLQFRLVANGKENIFVPQVIVKNENVVSQLDSQQVNIFKNKWEDKLKYDKYYNKNLSLIEPFRLDIKNNE